MIPVIVDDPKETSLLNSAHWLTISFNFVPSVSSSYFEPVPILTSLLMVKSSSINTSPLKVDAVPTVKKSSSKNVTSVPIATVFPTPAPPKDQLYPL